MSSKQKRMEELTKRVDRCHLCPFSFHRKNIVMSAGSITAKCALIGEAPGVTEDENAEAFCGPAGKDMTHIMEDFAIKREMLYICNLLKCWPNGPFVAKRNETPRPEWVRNCFGYLWEQMQIVQPKLIVLTGQPASIWTLNLPKSTMMKNIVGRRGVFESFGPYPVDWECKYVVMYHPAAAMHARNPERKAKIVKNMRDTFHYVRAQI